MSKRPPKVALPGEMYQKNGRWWWKVRLPGEPRVRERALKPDGALVATKTRKVAEEVACEKWRLAIEADAAARARAELKAETGQKIAKARAKAADAVAEANSECAEKIKACETALAEAERKAKVEASLRAEAEEAAQSHAEGLERVVARARTETKLRIEAEQRAAMEAQARAMAEARLEAETELRAEAEERAVQKSHMRAEAETTSSRVVDSSGRTAPCEGCGRDDVPENDLARIGSGQLVCSDCMMLARA